MMGKDILQFKSETDGCVYFFDFGRKMWRKICDIRQPTDLPADVRRQVREAQNDAEEILALPLGREAD